MFTSPNRPASSQPLHSPQRLEPGVTGGESHTLETSGVLWALFLGEDAENHRLPHPTVTHQSPGHPDRCIACLCLQMAQHGELTTHIP